MEGFSDGTTNWEAAATKRDIKYIRPEIIATYGVQQTKAGQVNEDEDHKNKEDNNLIYFLIDAL